MKKLLTFLIAAGIFFAVFINLVPENEHPFKKFASLFGIGGSDSTINIIMASEAIIREKTEADSKVMATVHVGDTVESLGFSTEYVNGEETHFHRVETKEGKKGWISDDFVAIGVLPAAIMKETRILNKPDAGADTGKSFLCGDFVVAIKKAGDFVEVRGQGRERETYHEDGNVTGYVPASALTYEPIDIVFATKHQRAIDETNPEVQDEMMAELGDADKWMDSDLFIALHSKSSDEEGEEGEEGDPTQDEGYEEEDPGFGIMQMQLMPPTDGLIAHYEMDHLAVEDATDFHHDGQSYEVRFDHDKVGSAMAAWLFNGKNSYVTIDHWQDEKLVPPFTIVAYAKTANIAQEDQTIASRGRSADGTGFNLGYTMKDNGSRIFYFGMIGAERPITVDVPTEIAADEWVFLAASYDTKEMKLYVNGALAGSTVVSRQDESAIVNYFDESDQPLEIGRELQSLGRYFNGSIDNLAIWNRALSDDEIAQMNH